MASRNPPVDSQGRVCPSTLHIRNLVDWAPFTTPLRKQAHMQVFEQDPLAVFAAMDDAPLTCLMELSWCAQTTRVSWQPAKRRHGRTGWYRVAVYVHRRLLRRNAVDKAHCLQDCRATDELDAELAQAARQHAPPVFAVQWVSPEQVTFADALLDAAPMEDILISEESVYNALESSGLVPDCAALVVMHMMRTEAIDTRAKRSKSAEAFREQLHDLLHALNIK